MKKVLLIIILLVVGCTKENKVFYLSDKYYNMGEFIKVAPNEISDNESFILYTYNSFCSLPVHCETIFKEVMEKYKIDVLSIPFDEFKSSSYYNEVKYAPSIILINNGKVIAYLDAESDEDLEEYQDTTKFEEWLKNYVYLEKSN